MNHTLLIILQILIAFATMAGNELLWALYIHNLRDNREHHAGIFMSFIVLLGGMSTILFVDHHWMLIPAAIGAWFGTWISQFFYKNDK